MRSCRSPYEILAEGLSTTGRTTAGCRSPYEILKKIGEGLAREMVAVLLMRFSGRPNRVLPRWIAVAVLLMRFYSSSTLSFCGSMSCRSPYEIPYGLDPTVLSKIATKLPFSL